MLITSWFSQLERARSVNEVVGVARDFIATLTTDELKLLPGDCRPGKLRDAADIEALHSMLVEAYRTSSATGNALDVLQRLTSFVVRASIRLADLDAARPTDRGNDPPGDSGRSSAPPEN